MATVPVIEICEECRGRFECELMAQDVLEIADSIGCELTDVIAQTRCAG